MPIVSEAVYDAFKPDKLNYERLGTGNAIHMHWHLFPRREGDIPVKGPVWKLDKKEMYAEKYRPTPSELEQYKQRLLKSLNKIQRQRNEAVKRAIERNIAEVVRLQRFFMESMKIFYSSYSLKNNMNRCILNQI